MKLPLLISTCVLIAARLSADIIHVDAAASGSADGSTWNNAFANHQSALSAAVSGDEIWVTRGFYLLSDPAIAGDPRSARNG